jgi:UDP-GlcNAc:polypeptide alpha-N-acetylglucosaminyltransferase
MVIDKLFRGEDYVFQIDSHSRFVPDWDLILMNNIEQLPPKSCISHYPSTWDPKVDGNQLPKDYDLLIARMCKGFYNNEHILIPVCGLMTLKERRSVPALIAGAGMTLYPGSVHKDMDMDPHLPFLFQGEELLFTMRMVSKGYKVFSPAENIVFHYYGRKDNAKFFDLSAQVPDMEQQRQQSLQRAKYIMGYLPKEQLTNPSVSLIEIDKYKIDWEDPIVKARMDKYFKVFDINLAEKKVGDLCSKGELDDWPIWD